MLLLTRTHLAFRDGLHMCSCAQCDLDMSRWKMLSRTDLAMQDNDFDCGSFVCRVRSAFLHECIFVPVIVCKQTSKATRNTDAPLQSPCRYCVAADGWSSGIAASSTLSMPAEVNLSDLTATWPRFGGEYVLPSLHCDGCDPMSPAIARGSGRACLLRHGLPLPARP